MANEGIMALPAGMGMQEDQPTTPSVTSADSYDAATTAQGMVDPQTLAVVKESLRQNLSDLEMTPGELEMLIEMFEYMSQRPDQYKKLRDELISRGMLDDSDLPEDYDPEFIGTILIVLNELRLMRADTALAPMASGPGAMAAGPLPMAKGGLADAAQYLASKGRNGDTMLAHITPEEARMLKSMGGAGTINPETGLPEFFFKSIFKAVSSVVKSVVNVAKQVLQSPIGKIVSTIALATVLGPAGVGLSMGTAAGLASAGTTLLSGGNLKQALISGAMGYIGGGGTIGGFSPMSAISSYLPGAAGSMLNTGLSAGALGTGVGLLTGMKPSEALKAGAMAGLQSAAVAGLQPSSAKAATQGAEAPISPTAEATTQPRAVGGVGTTGTAQDILASGQGLRPPAMDFGAPDYAAAAGGTGVDTNFSLVPRGTPQTGGLGLQQSGGLGLQPTTTPFGATDFARAAGGTAATTNYNLTPRAAMSSATSAATQPNLFDRAVSGAKDIYNQYLSPSRPGLPADAGILRRYGPLMLAGTAVAGASGGMQTTPANPNPLFNRNYTSADYMRDNPDKFRGGLDNPLPPPPTGFFSTPSYASRDITGIPISLPGGVTRTNAGVAQPYNVAGLYGIPLLYGQDPRAMMDYGNPQGMASGGEMQMKDFPRKNGPIDGPGTGTSDSIPAMLSDGEFVFTAKAVRNAGGGSRRKGAARMYKMMKMLEGGPVKGK